MMETETVSEMLGCNSIPTRLIAREDFIAFNDDVLITRIISCGIQVAVWLWMMNGEGFKSSKGLLEGLLGQVEETIR
jgi:hypothetical protein